MNSYKATLSKIWANTEQRRGEEKSYDTIFRYEIQLIIKKPDKVELGPCYDMETVFPVMSFPMMKIR